MSFDGIDKGFVKRNGEFRRSGIDKAGTPTFAAVAVERELADDEDRAADLRHVPIHFPVIVIENSKCDDLVGQPASLFFSVGLGDAQQNE